MNILIYVCIGLFVGMLIAALLVVPPLIGSSQETRREEARQGRLL